MLLEFVNNVDTPIEVSNTFKYATEEHRRIIILQLIKNWKKILHQFHIAFKRMNRYYKNNINKLESENDSIINFNPNDYEKER